MTSGLVRVARVLRAPARRLSSGTRPSYVHPLSEEVLSELRALRPAWFEEDAIEHDASALRRILERSSVSLCSESEESTAEGGLRYA